MKPRKSHYVWVAAAAAGLSTFGAHGGEAAFPAKPVTIIMPYAAGGSSDIMTRTLAKSLTEIWGRNAIVENRPGASGMIGAEVVAKAAPDGYTLLSTTSSYPGTVAVRAKLPFDPEKAFIPVAMIARAPIVLAVHPSMPAKTVKEFIALAKKRPLNYSSSGTGGNNHIAMELFSQAAGIKMTHIPYKGIAPGVVALIAGEVDAIIASSPAVMSQVKAGKARAIAVSSPKPTPLVPGLPAIAESGVPGFTYENWWGVFAPAGTPANVVNTINSSINKALVGAEMRTMFEREGAEGAPMSVAQLADLLPKEIARYRKAAQAAGLKPE
ncbi:MAG TPA: tripartite tricarboxylate transporter substrate binding protein [Burkholderiales bacterium]|nr:tripartite tricarboxylate transporter substrate binding protein [Burkholderiales bacterium]